MPKCKHRLKSGAGGGTDDRLKSVAPTSLPREPRSGWRPQAANLMGGFHEETGCIRTWNNGKRFVIGCWWTDRANALSVKSSACTGTRCRRSWAIPSPPATGCNRPAGSGSLKPSSRSSIRSSRMTACKSPSNGPADLRSTQGGKRLRRGHHDREGCGAGVASS